MRGGGSTLVMHIRNTPRLLSHSLYPSLQQSPAAQLSFESKTLCSTIGRHGGLHGDQRPKSLTLCACWTSPSMLALS